MLSLPCAKINIGLNVTRKRSDGYHDIETVFYPIPLTDVLEIKPLCAEDDEDVQIIGMPCDADVHDNLVYRVYADLRREFALPAMSVYLYKKIPVGAGLGGGSSDAAETIKMINELFALGLDNDDMARRIARYGADCAFFIRRTPVFARGIGDVFSNIRLTLGGMYLVLVKPDIFVSTREAYAGIVPKTAERDLRQCVESEIDSWRNTVTNDFETHVFKLYPLLAAIKQTLYDMGALYAAMSGSGSTLYGIFDRPVEEAVTVFSDCFVFEKQLR